MNEIDARRRKILASLERYCDRHKDDEGAAAKGARPMDLGAWDASHHSNDLRAMAKHGLVQVVPRFTGILGAMGYSGSNRYAITDKGRVALRKAAESL